MSKMPRLGINVTQEMYDALQAEADKRGATIANLVREYVLRGLQGDGHEVEKYKIVWGGGRGRHKENEDSDT
jgi:hypothetical protein